MEQIIVRLMDRENELRRRIEELNASVFDLSEKLNEERNRNDILYGRLDILDNKIKDVLGISYYDDIPDDWTSLVQRKRSRRKND